MTDERRYGDSEVAEILEAAARHRDTEGHALAPVSGLSLAELQAIGGEVGIAPEHIAQAALAMDLRRSAAPRRTYLGIPISVGRTVELPRAPTDHEWNLLVAELRATFGAHGKDRSEGDLRAWTNGNLRAYVEPTVTGYRLRLGTTKGDGVAMARMGTAGLLAALVMLVALFVTGDLSEEIGMAVLFAVMGAGALGSTALRLPRWASEREEQMEHIAARALTLIRAEPEPALIGSGG